MYLFAIFLFIASSCKKQKECCIGAAPGLLYQVINKDGENILNSPKDSITLTYNNMQFYDYVFELITTTPPGLTLFDGKMLQLNAGIGVPNPIHTFKLSYKGQDLGNIYLDSVKQHSNWQEAKVFTFNNAPVKLDSSSGRHIYVIQLQQ